MRRVLAFQKRCTTAFGQHEQPWLWVPAFAGTTDEMSPDLAFILTLALRMAITAAFVVSASVITERSGP